MRDLIYVVAALVLIAVLYRRVAEWDRAHEELESRNEQHRRP